MNSSTTLAKSGIVNVVAPIVCDVSAIVTSWPFVKSKGDAAEVARDVADATPRTGVTRVGEVENTRLVEVVPVDPAAVNPVMLLNAVMLAELAFVPPLATGNTLTQEPTPPVVAVSTAPAAPGTAVGQVKLHVPAAAATVSVNVPLVVPLNRIEPVVPAATPIVSEVPIHALLAALSPPLVRIAPVMLLEASSVEGANSEALAPVPPMVNNVVAPAKAVNEVEAVVIDVVISGLVIDCTPVNVCAASVRAMVAVVVGNV